MFSNMLSYGHSEWSMQIISRTVILLSVVSLLADVASEMLYPVMPAYLSEIGFSIFLIGILEGLVQFIAGVSKGYFGQWSDLKGQRLPFLKGGYLLSAISKPMMAVWTWLPWIFLARSLDRLGKGMRTAPRDALLSAEATSQTKARVFGFHRSMDTLGAAIGPMLSFVFLLQFPGRYETLFYLAFIPGLFSVLLLFLIKEKKIQGKSVQPEHFFSYFQYWKNANPLFRKIVPAFLAFSLVNSSDVFLLLMTRQSLENVTIRFSGQTLTAETITIAAYIFYNLVYALASFPAGWLADKLGFKKIILAGILVYAVVYGGFASQPSLPAIFSLFGLYGIYAAATEGVIKAWIANLSSPKDTATAIGFYTSCESICILLASILAGAVWTVFGSSIMFLFTAGISLGVMIYLALNVNVR
ncbi:MAG: MFS transporter [Chitinophagaceae bacterium]|nr:MFS transporter [Chitinophagaceae bacterium]